MASVQNTREKIRRVNRACALVGPSVAQSLPSGNHAEFYWDFQAVLYLASLIIFAIVNITITVNGKRIVSSSYFSQPIGQMRGFPARGLFYYLYACSQFNFLYWIKELLFTDLVYILLLVCL